jgi:hypothetical protein
MASKLLFNENDSFVQLLHCEGTGKTYRFSEPRRVTDLNRDITPAVLKMEGFRMNLNMRPVVLTSYYRGQFVRQDVNEVGDQRFNAWNVSHPAMVQGRGGAPRLFVKK